MEMFGFRRGQGWSDFAHEIRWRDFWSAMMGPAIDEEAESDVAARIDHWQSWLDHRGRSEDARAI